MQQPTTNKQKAQKLAGSMRTILDRIEQIQSDLTITTEPSEHVERIKGIEVPSEAELSHAEELADIDWKSRTVVKDEVIEDLRKSRDILRRYACALRQVASGFFRFVKPAKASRGKAAPDEVGDRIAALLNALDALDPKQIEGELAQRCAAMRADVLHELALDGFESEYRRPNLDRPGKWKVQPEDE